MLSCLLCFFGCGCCQRCISEKIEQELLKIEQQIVELQTKINTYNKEISPTIDKIKACEKEFNARRKNGLLAAEEAGQAWCIAKRNELDLTTARNEAQEQLLKLQQHQQELEKALRPPLHMVVTYTPTNLPDEKPVENQTSPNENTQPSSSKEAEKWLAVPNLNTP